MCVADSVAAAAGQTAEQKLVLAHKALLQTRGLQFDFAAVPPQKPPAWLDPLIAFLKVIGPVLQYVFWGGLIVGGALVLWFVLREFIPEDLFRKKRALEAATDWRPDAEVAQALLTDAEALAAAGRFEEAIHMLLFRSIDELAKRRPGQVRPALTSRDIAALDALPAQPRAAFARLAQAVERTFFGGRPAGSEEFQAAREDYRAFAFAEAWR
jgi:hypothetical protein